MFLTLEKLFYIKYYIHSIELLWRQMLTQPVGTIVIQMPKLHQRHLAHFSAKKNTLYSCAVCFAHDPIAQSLRTFGRAIFETRIYSEFIAIYWCAYLRSI